MAGSGDVLQWKIKRSYMISFTLVEKCFLYRGHYSIDWKCGDLIKYLYWVLSRMAPVVPVSKPMYRGWQKEKDIKKHIETLLDTLEKYMKEQRPGYYDIKTWRALNVIKG